MDESQIANLIFSFAIAFVFYLSGLLMKKYPPKDINGVYGYRTNRSMKSKELWNEANRYSADIMKTYALLFLIISCVLSLLFKGVAITFIIMGIMILFFVLMFIRVEKRLAEMERDALK